MIPNLSQQVEVTSAVNDSPYFKAMILRHAAERSGAIRAEAERDPEGTLNDMRVDMSPREDQSGVRSVIVVSPYGAKIEVPLLERDPVTQRTLYTHDFIDGCIYAAKKAERGGSISVKELIATMIDQDNSARKSPDDFPRNQTDFIPSRGDVFILDDCRNFGVEPVVWMVTHTHPDQNGLLHIVPAEWTTKGQLITNCDLPANTTSGASAILIRWSQGMWCPAAAIKASDYVARVERPDVDAVQQALADMVRGKGEAVPGVQELTDEWDERQDQIAMLSARLQEKIDGTLAPIKSAASLAAEIDGMTSLDRLFSDATEIDVRESIALIYKQAAPEPGTMIAKMDPHFGVTSTIAARQQIGEAFIRKYEQLVLPELEKFADYDRERYRAEGNKLIVFLHDASTYLEILGSGIPEETRVPALWRGLSGAVQALEVLDEALNPTVDLFDLVRSNLSGAVRVLSNRHTESQGESSQQPEITDTFGVESQRRAAFFADLDRTFGRPRPDEPLPPLPDLSGPTR